MTANPIKECRQGDIRVRSESDVSMISHESHPDEVETRPLSNTKAADTPVTTDAPADKDSIRPLRLFFVFALMGATCLAAPLIGLVGRDYDGSWTAWWKDNNGPWVRFEFTGEAFLFWFVWLAVQAILLKFSKHVEGAKTPTEHVPVYRLGGVTSFFVNCGLWAIGWPMPRSWLYDNLLAVLCAAHVLALALCLVLMLKGLYAPSSRDSGSSGSWIMDYYWGTELHPEIFGVQIKQLINCRVGMMVWPVMILSFGAAAPTVTPALAVSIGLQLVYILKFFAWESGYLRSMDMQHDRAGYYTQWGCFVWVPAFYTCATLAYVNYTNDDWILPTLAALIGVASIYANWDADVQKYNFKLHGDSTKIWGKPVESIPTAHGTKLLVSGWWGIARHIHYIFEVLGALMWCAPGAYPGDLYPYMYVIYLTILLGHRLFRDDIRCSKKYGKAWEQYCQRVPHKLIPYVY